MSNPLLKHFPEEVIRHTTDLCGRFFEKNCCSKFIHNLDYNDSECIKMFTAKLLGYGIVVAASAVKLPQVFKIYGAKSGAGLALFGVFLELLAITFNSCYSFRNDFPFSAWGEAIFLAIETAIIAFLILWYDNNKRRSISFILGYITLVLALTHPTLVRKDIMWWLQSTVLPLSVSGKLVQAFKNYKAQHTGQISAVTAISIFLGSITRIFTTIQETGDMLTTVTFACSAVANSMIVFQVLYYWKSTEKFLEKGRKKKAN